MHKTNEAFIYLFFLLSGKCGANSPCVQLCVELHDGTFECQCRSGYRLLLDGYSCVGK